MRLGEPEGRVQSAEQIAEGIHVLGGAEPLDGRISWVHPELRGVLPVNCYLIVEGDEGLLVDSGVSAHEDVVVGQLSDEAAGLSRLSLLLTRIVEFDSIGNAARILRSFPVDRLHAHHPWPNWVDLDEDTVPSLDPALEGVRLGAERHIHVDRQGRRTLEILDPTLRLLQTSWVLDVRTGTLFTSDAFGHVPMRRADGPRVVTEATDTTFTQDVRAGLDAKFDWLRRADVRRVRDELERLFATHDVQTIAPGFGCVLQGPGPVRRHVDMVLECLDELLEQAA